MFCNNCGFEIPDDSPYCPRCGVPISTQQKDDFDLLPVVYGPPPWLDDSQDLDDPSGGVMFQ